MQKHTITDHIFWFILILFSNPGGIQKALGIYEFGKGGVNLNDFLFIFMAVLFFLIPHNFHLKMKDYSKTGIYLVVFLVYYLVIFGYVTPAINNSQSQNILLNFIKLRWIIYSIGIFFITYQFYLRSYMIFFRFLAYSSIFILLLFLFSVITGTDILPYEEMNRGFVNIDRKLLTSYGFMPMLIPIGVTLLIFNINSAFRKILLIGALMMFIAWLISITRRHIFGTIIYFILAYLLNTYINRDKLRFLLPLIRVSVVLLIVTVIISFSFPGYFQAGAKSITETVNVIQHGETIEGNKDERLSLNKEFIVNLFIKNPLLGTGFDNNWRTGEGDKLGYEATDYPLLSAMAMTGITGLLIFLPIYVILLKALRQDIRYLRRKPFGNYPFNKFMLILFIIYFIYTLIQYMNWFGFVSNPSSYEFMVFLAMYYASREIYYTTVNNKIIYAKK